MRGRFKWKLINYISLFLGKCDLLFLSLSIGDVFVWVLYDVSWLTGDDITDLVDLKVIELFNILINLHFLLLLRITGILRLSNAFCLRNLGADLRSSKILFGQSGSSGLRSWTTFWDFLIESLDSSSIKLASGLSILTKIRSNLSSHDSWTTHLNTGLRSLRRSFSWVKQFTLGGISVLAVSVGVITASTFWGQQSTSWHGSLGCEYSTHVCSETSGVWVTTSFLLILKVRNKVWIVQPLAVCLVHLVVQRAIRRILSYNFILKEIRCYSGNFSKRTTTIKHHI